MTHPPPVAEWLATRTPAPPRHLAARIQALAARGEDRAPTPEDPAPAERLLEAAETAMGVLLGDGCLTRESARELLAVDALVTYAFEAAADRPERLEELAGAALARIAALATSADA